MTLIGAPALGDTKHTELVNMLKADYGLGHGHANALVAYWKSKQG